LDVTLALDADGGLREGIPRGGGVAAFAPDVGEVAPVVFVLIECAAADGDLVAELVVDVEGGAAEAALAVVAVGGLGEVAEFGCLVERLSVPPALVSPKTSAFGPRAESRRSVT
jgi:hypothetical protein